MGTEYNNNGQLSLILAVGTNHCCCTRFPSVFHSLQTGLYNEKPAVTVIIVFSHGWFSLSFYSAMINCTLNGTCKPFVKSVNISFVTLLPFPLPLYMSQFTNCLANTACYPFIVLVYYITVP